MYSLSYRAIGRYAIFACAANIPKKNHILYPQYELPSIESQLISQLQVMVYWSVKTKVAEDRERNNIDKLVAAAANEKGYKAAYIRYVILSRAFLKPVLSLAFHNLFLRLSKVFTDSDCT